MARGVKKAKATLTPEEKLAQALVPVEEQPYPVPGNWCWVNMNQIAELFNGDRGINYPSKKDYVDTGIPFINAGAIKEGRLDCNDYNYITELKYSALRAGKIQKDDILYCLRGSLGKTAIIDFYGRGAISSSLCILRVKPTMLVKYLYYLLSSNTIERQQDGAENGSAQPNLSAASVLKYKIPFPPLAEQQRIVDRIESLFAKLDVAKEKAQAVVDGFEDRKAAILHRAFTGKLTGGASEATLDWEKWEAVSLKDIVHGFKYGTSEKSDYEYKGMPVLRIPNLTDDGVDFSDIKYLSDIDVDKENQVHKGDILIIRSNGSRDLVGKCALVPELNQEYAYASFLIRIVPSERVRADFLVLYLNSIDARSQMFDKAKSSAGIHNINSKELGSISLDLPSLEEQESIVSCLQRLLLKEQQAKEAAEQTLTQIDTMKKAILARAFRGELGTNDPTDESAEELLKQTV